MKASLLLLLVITAGGCSNPTAPPPSSTTSTTLHDLGSLGSWTKARSLNDAGQVAAWSGATPANLQPVILQDGAVSRLETPPGVSTGMADAINAHGTVAGIIGLPDGWSITTWDAGVRHSAPALPAALDAQVVTINDNGDVLAVWEEEQPFHARAAVWRGGAGIEGIGHLGTIAQTVPTGMNDRGQVIGRSAVAYEPTESTDPNVSQDMDEAWVIYHPFIWEGDAPRDLGVFGKTTDCRRSAPCAGGVALAINKQGVVVGYAQDSALLRRPFVWQDGALRDLGAFPGRAAVARVINNQGVIAGDAGGVAFVWTAGVTQVIGSLGGGYMEVTAINERGDVAGTGLTAGGEQHAWVWSGGVFTDLGTGLPNAQGASAVAINASGAVLVAAVTTCYRNRPENPHLCNFSYNGPNRALLWRAATP